MVKLKWKSFFKSGKNYIYFINIYIMSRKKGITKVKVGFSIDKEIIDEFNSYCELNSINKSKLINKILFDFINKKSYQDN